MTNHPPCSNPSNGRRFARRGVLLALLAAAAGCTPGDLPPLTPSDPEPPPQGALDLTSTGPCGQLQVSFDNPVEDANLVHVFSPTGTAAAPLTGGTCNDAARPVLFFSHGHMANDPSLFSDLIHHFVSQGHILVFAEYRGLDAVDLDGDAYPIVDAGFVAATEHSVIAQRGDLGRVGFMGHSMGAGMVPWLLQQAEPRGWGSESIWAVMMAPYWALAVGDAPTIDVPAGLHALVIGFDHDTTNDNAIGAEIFEALDLPDSDKAYVLVQGDEYGDPALETSHTLPQTLTTTSDSSPREDDLLRIYGIYRNTNALASCATYGTSCGVDMTFMGRWSDGTPITPAVVTDDPVDSGAGATITCGSLSNPRRDYCP